MSTATAQMTVEQFWKLCGDGCGRELVAGEVIEVAPASARHGRVAAKVVTRLVSFAAERRLGEIYTADAGFLLSRNPDTVRAPDVAFVRQARLVDEPGEGYFPGAPDLAVEVVSPNDLAQAVERKVQDYLAAGTMMVWVLYPDTRHLVVYRPDGRARVLSEKDTVEGEELLPEFACQVAELFGK